MKLIECVPNFSEGRDRSVIDAIAGAAAGVDGVELLGVEPGAATNRTVVTFAGPLEAVEEAAFRSIAQAAELIDMRVQQGEHPRMGATDVCPFVPLEGSTMEDCIDVARRLGARVGAELGIPVYLYEYAASQGRRSLADVRRGEYEGLADRPDAPDFGPRYNASSGATAVGARQFLIAYNINLNTTDRRLAHRVAQAVRETGAPKRSEDGAILKDGEGKTVFEPGRFKEVKGIGWFIDEYRRAQVSLNLTDFEISPLHEVFEAAREEAAALGMRVTGSELIGLIPRRALLAAGDYFLSRQGSSTAVPEVDRIHAAVLSLGLEELAPFDPRAKIVEYAYHGGAGSLTAKPVDEFLDTVSRATPTPGGGSVAALLGSLSATLTAMVAGLTWSKAGMETVRPMMDTLGNRAHELKDWFARAVDRDAAAFDAVLAARRLPRKSPDEVDARKAAIRAANLEATLVPLEVLERCVEALGLARAVAAEGSPSSVSDAGVGAWSALAAAEGAAMNVRVNLSGLDGADDELADRANGALAEARQLAADIARLVEERL